MLSRENRVQLAAMVAALLVLVGFALFLPDDPGPTWIGVFALVFYGVAFGGAHLYLYLVDGGDAIPRSARGRFLVVLGLVLPLWAGNAVVQGHSIGPVNLTLALGVLSLCIFVAYFLNEMRLGYGEFEESAGGSG